MTEARRPNPAEAAAQRALESVYECIRERKNFKLEAGAGAGKTYSLIKALEFVIKNYGPELLRKYQQVACITYTNVATDEIKSRTDGHPAVHASTIHSFCWLLIRNFQPFLREKLREIKGWPEMLEVIGGAGQRHVVYDLGHRQARPEELSLGHNDVLALTVKIMGYKKFRDILVARFPFLFIDEYHDTDKNFVKSIKEHFLNSGEGPLIGLFGDSWQKIYPDGCGLIEHDNLTLIGKKANFRSVKAIVDFLNRMRPKLTQEVVDPNAKGTVVVYHSNDWVGTRRTGPHWKGDLPPGDASNCLKSVQQRLANEGWDFSPEKTKILILTHKLLAKEQDYGGIAGTFKYTESFIKREHPLIKFLVDIFEPASIAYQNERYGEMFSAFGRQSLKIRSLDDKRKWSQEMNALVKLRKAGAIDDVLNYLKVTERLRLPDAVLKTEAELSNASPVEVSESRRLTEAEKLKDIPYREIVSLTQFLNDHTPFSTKHGVKGAEFENVLVVLGRGWSHYNWNRFLELSHSSCNVPIERRDFYEKNRNLFYVACTRSKKRLALLFTQKLSDEALETLTHWFGEGAIISIF